ncbi:MAG: hypothetical protein C0434_07190 [Xanthomonadaceae bacterium]|nr:hypothetical protein [Xanthomonadaceae bacterium]
MPDRKWLPALCGPALAVAMMMGLPAAEAHHAFAAEFDADQPVQLDGVVTRIQWVNPHSWLYVDVKQPDGSLVNWALEFGAPFALQQKGLKKSDFPIGVPVAVKGFRSKSGKPVANASSVKLADGRDFYTAAQDSPDTPPP